MTTQNEIDNLNRASELYNLGMTYLLGFKFGVKTEKNNHKAFRLVLEAAYLGFTEAEFTLGAMFLKSLGTDQNIEQAVYWYEKAAKKGHVQAHYRLGLHYYCGDYGIEKDWFKASEWFTKAAEQGDKNSMFMLYLINKGDDSLGQDDDIEPDLDRAWYWLNLALEKNHINALSDLGHFYYHGNDKFKIEKNFDKAFIYLHQAAVLGAPESYFTLGQMYCLAQGVNQNINEGKAWVQRAADNNFPLAKSFLQVIKAGGFTYREKVSN